MWGPHSVAASTLPRGVLDPGACLEAHFVCMHLQGLWCAVATAAVVGEGARAHGASGGDSRPPVPPSVLAAAVQELTAIVGPDNVSVDEAETAEYGADKFSFHTGPGCVAMLAQQPVPVVKGARTRHLTALPSPHQPTTLPPPTRLPRVAQPQCCGVPLLHSGRK
jgi:hypothetical protein